MTSGTGSTGISVNLCLLKMFLYDESGARAALPFLSMGVSRRDLEVKMGDIGRLKVKAS
jgi:hypothetical protein